MLIEFVLERGEGLAGGGGLGGVVFEFIFGAKSLYERFRVVAKIKISF